MPDWKRHLAFEDAAGRHPAKFDLDPDPKAATYVRCRVYGQKFASPFNPDTWFTGIKVDKNTGASRTSAWPGKIVNVDIDLMVGLDPETGQPFKYTLAEAAKILGTAQAGDPIVKVHVTVERKSGAKDMVGSVAV